MPSSSASASGERRNSLIGGGSARRKAAPCPPLDVLGELRYLFVGRDPAPLAARQGRFGLFGGRKDLQPPPLALFPKRHGLLHRILLAVESASLYAMADQRLLVGGQM